ncbi:tetratricopeptide repeat protein [Candidatus Tisiphia endosymbiont of Xenochironomus xenolabis]|uniref:tetratricopeptide repeat protein n=1 Tax=Candidatus Tisiphia endosymbiont of Xenochironomus xenolabis TaxID=3139334 RepID=UPI0035C90CA0
MGKRKLDFIYIVNSGEFGARRDGATPIINRRALIDNVPNFSSIDYRYLIILILLIMPLNSFAQNQIANQLSNFVAPVTYFVDHVKQLALLTNNLTKYRQASIIGTSGMGKTQLARMYCYENQNNYKLIWFIDCNLDINQELLKLAKAINSMINNSTKSTLIPEDIVLVRKEIMNYLSSQDKWLIIFDNLKVSENKKVQEFVDWENNGHVIFCSQDSEILPNIVKMTALAKNDVSILANNILENNDPKVVEFLSEEFAGYPIMTVQGIQLLNNVKGLDKAEYKKKIQQSTDRIKSNIILTINQLKPSARNLLNKIALMNNQGFSKDLLSFITDDQRTLNNDIYELSKFALISNIDPQEANPIFETHDIIVQKIAEINGSRNNKSYLEDIITKLMNYIPKNAVKARIFRNAKTIQENFEIILRNSEKYNINIYKIMALNLQIMVQHHNSLNYSIVAKKAIWFNKADQEGKFKLWLMNNDEKYAYIRYMQTIGLYHISYSNYRAARECFIRGQEIFENVAGYESYKWTLFYSLAICNIILGQVQEAEKNIQIMEKMSNEGLMDQSELSYIHILKAQLLFIQGKYTESLEQNSKTIENFIKNGLSPDDLFFIPLYTLKIEILNYLGKYQEAYEQAKKLYNLCKHCKDPEALGCIYSVMARSELGLGMLNQASEHVNKAISIFLVDERRNPKNADYLEDPDLAAMYVVQGDILFTQDNIKSAIESYNKAYTIYYYLYRDNRKNMAYVSYLYSQGAKAACKAKNLFSYKFFGKPQVKEFGINHPNTVSMFEYCKQYDMDLWAKEK